jgi:hypothetical protein
MRKTPGVLRGREESTTLRMCRSGVPEVSKVHTGVLRISKIKYIIDWLCSVEVDAADYANSKRYGGVVVVTETERGLVKDRH